MALPKWATEGFGAVAHSTNRDKRVFGVQAGLSGKTNHFRSTGLLQSMREHSRLEAEAQKAEQHFAHQYLMKVNGKGEPVANSTFVHTDGMTYASDARGMIRFVDPTIANEAYKKNQEFEDFVMTRLHLYTQTSDDIAMDLLGLDQGEAKNYLGQGGAPPGCDDMPDDLKLIDCRPSVLRYTSGKPSQKAALKWIYILERYLSPFMEPEMSVQEARTTDIAKNNGGKGIFGLEGQTVDISGPGARQNNPRLGAVLGGKGGGDNE